MAKRSKIIAKNLSEKLRQLGLSQTELAKRVGVTPQYISQIIKEKNESPSFGHLEAIAEAVGLTFFELVTLPEERKANHTAVDCFDVVRNVMMMLRDGRGAEAYNLLQKKT